jgi:hypothetical protein
MVARVAASQPGAQARDVLAELSGTELTAKRIERSAQGGGQVVAAAITAEADAVLAGNLHQLDTGTEPVDTLYVTMDGTGVPCVPDATQGHARKRDDGRARTREAKLACLFTQSGLDDDGRPVRDPHGFSYVATFESSEAFGTLVYAEARRRGVHSARRRVVSGDGVTWIWSLAATPFPHATGIVNLDRGDIPCLAAAARTLVLPDSLAAESDDALGYCETYQTRMRYAKFRKKRPAHRLRRDGSRLPRRGRRTPQTLRHALEHPRRHRNPHPALPPSIRPQGPTLDPPRAHHPLRLTSPTRGSLTARARPGPKRAKSACW